MGPPPRQLWDQTLVPPGMDHRGPRVPVNLPVHSALTVVAGPGGRGRPDPTGLYEGNRETCYPPFPIGNRGLGRRLAGQPTTKNALGQGEVGALPEAARPH